MYAEIGREIFYEYILQIYIKQTFSDVIYAEASDFIYFIIYEII